MPEIGQRHKRLVAITAHYGEHGRLKCKVRCDCGVEKEIWAGNFYKTASCGCFQEETRGAHSITHGFRRGVGQRKPPPEYVLWGNMIQRCHNPRNHTFARYGARGVRVCARWRRSFPAFLRDIGARPSPQHSIDRFPDNNGDYKPGNVRWATRTEQARNKRSNRLVSVDGVSLSLAEVAARSGVNYGTLHSRLERGWLPSEAVQLKDGRASGGRRWPEGARYDRRKRGAGVTAAVAAARAKRGESNDG